MKITKSSKWELDNTQYHIGCGLDNNIGYYKIIDNQEQIGEITYEIRSSYDPLLWARKKTSMKLDFGLPSNDWKGMGIALILLSVFLAIQPAAYFKKRMYGQLPEAPIFIEFASIRK